MLSADGEELKPGDVIWVANDVQGWPPVRHVVGRFAGVQIIFDITDLNASRTNCRGCHKRVAFKSLQSALIDALKKIAVEEADPRNSTKDADFAARPELFQLATCIVNRLEADLEPGESTWGDEYTGAKRLLFGEYRRVITNSIVDVLSEHPKMRLTNTF